MVKQWGLALGLRNYDLWEIRIGQRYQWDSVFIGQSSQSASSAGGLESSLRIWTPEIALRLSPGTKSLIRPLIQVAVGLPISEGSGLTWGTGTKSTISEMSGIGLQVSGGIGAGVLIRGHLRAQFLIGFRKDWTRWTMRVPDGNTSRLPAETAAALDAQLERVTLRFELGWEF